MMDVNGNDDYLNGNCSIYNATTLAKFFNSSTANRTLAIEALLNTTCRPEVCSLAWGSPNPDLSGIGVGIRIRSDSLASIDVYDAQTVISYMVQTGLIALFGLYYIIPGMLARLGFKYPEKIHHHFRAANFLMATSFFVAEVWHLSQSPGIVSYKQSWARAPLTRRTSETDFMRMLAQLQTIQYTVITFGIVAALGAFGETTSYLSISQLLMGGDNLRIIDLLTPLFPIVYLILDGTNYADPGSWQQDVADACPDTYNANEGLASQDADLTGLHVSCVDLEHLMSDVLFFRTYIVIMVLQVLYGIVFAMFWYGSQCFAPSENGLRRHVKRHQKWYRMVPKIGLAVCVLLTAALVLGLWLYRTCVDKVEDYQEDNQWSIGQVLAPAAWRP
ncbi:hypothetical protein N0V82_009718 [Gnomoniopsis sp. IMI 355080]|nr:hypothetical protein N0V82_009718 [Gnomoniopsis sp. IMI 355080]